MTAKRPASQHRTPPSFPLVARTTGETSNPISSQSRLAPRGAADISILFFALAGLVFSLYLGSAWYDRMLTSHVTKKVRKHIAASTAKND